MAQTQLAEQDWELAEVRAESDCQLTELRAEHDRQLAELRAELDRQLTVMRVERDTLQQESLHQNSRAAYYVAAYNVAVPVAQ